MNEKRIPWNKGKKQEIKKLNYTNGTTNIKINEGDPIPEGFYRGQVRHMTKELFDEHKKIQVAKTRETKLKRYGSEKYNNTEKRYQTNLEKYGSENYTQTEEFRKKSESTCLKRYGTKNVMSVTEIKERYKKALFDKYGVKNISQISSYRQKIQNTWYNKSEEELAEIVDKRIKTNLEKYGVEFYCATEECKEKIQNTCLEKYGKPYYVLTDDFRKSFNSQDSKPNLFFKQKLEEANIPFEREFTIGYKSYDFKVDNYLIEINPTPTHNSTLGIFNNPPLDKFYHRKKSELARDAGYSCINVWDWDDLDKVINLLKPRQKIYARKCQKKEISLIEANEFLNIYHLQGAIKASRCFALIYENEIVSVMTFGKPRYNKKYEYELLRYAASKDIIGGAEKLFKFSLERLNINRLISYCDCNKFDGTVYNKLGFKKIRVSICKHWYKIKTGQHITDNLLRTHGFDRLLGEQYGKYGKGSSNEDLMKNFGFLEIYDAGQATYIYEK